MSASGTPHHGGVVDGPVRDDGPVIAPARVGGQAPTAARWGVLAALVLAVGAAWWGFEHWAPRWLERREALVLFTALVAGVASLWAVHRMRADARLAAGDVGRAFANLADAEPVIVWVSDPQGRWTFANRAWSRLTGRPPESALGDGWLTSVHPEDRGRWLTNIERALGEKRAVSFEYRLRTPGGGERWMLETAGPRSDALGRVVGLAGSGLDITDRRSGEQAVRESDATVRGFFESVPMYMGVMELVGDDLVQVSANEASARAQGATPETVAGRRLSELLRDAGAVDLWRRRCLEAMATRTPVRAEAEIGGSRPLTLSVTVAPTIRGGDGRPRFAYVIENVTDERRIQRELGELRAAMENAVEGVARVGVNGRYASVNPAFAEMHLRRPAEMEGLEPGEFVHPEDRASLRAHTQSLRLRDKVECELRGLRRDGSVFFQRTVLVAIHEAPGRAAGHYSFMKDISQRKREEQELREALARREEMLERENLLRRELDHRVRNNLASLLGLIGLYERSKTSAPELGQAVRGKVRAIKEVHDLVSAARGRPIDLRAFVQKLAGEFLPADRSPAVCLSGPKVEIPAPQAGALAMILQELFTNSRKHGAISTPGGAISIEWVRLLPGQEHNFRMTWKESRPAGSPEPAALVDVGRTSGHVGIKLIEGLAASELQGRCEFRFDAGGLVFQLFAVLEGGGGHGDGPPGPGGALNGR